MASYDLLNINTSVYSTAAGRGQAAAKAIESAIDELLAAMRAATSSAGHGAGADFAAKYEPGVSLLLQETANLIGSLYTISGMFTDTGNWHDELEKFNATGKPFTPPLQDPDGGGHDPSAGFDSGWNGSETERMELHREVRDGGVAGC